MQQRLLEAPRLSRVFSELPLRRELRLVVLVLQLALLELPLVLVGLAPQPLQLLHKQVC